MKTSGIYMIVCNGYYYIGKSTNIEQRIKQHERSARKPKSTLHKAMNNHTWDWQILQTAKKRDLNKLEQYWIAHYNSFKRGYNMTLGGDTSYKSTVAQIGQKEIWPKI